MNLSATAVSEAPSATATITDQDGLPDDWEQQIIEADPYDNIETIADVNPDDDFNGSGRSNRVEYAFGLDPTGPDENPWDVKVAEDEDSTAQLEASFNVRSPGLDVAYVLEICSDLNEGEWEGGRLEHVNGTWQSRDTRFSVVGQS